MRRREFAHDDRQTAIEVLEAARYGHLATTGADGEPEVRPMNYALQDGNVYLHCAEGGTMHARAGNRAVLSAIDTAVWLPSYWRHPAMACPATTWYRSVQVRGTLRAVESLDEKATALQAFMRRYQPEGGHAEIVSGRRYDGPLRALTVLALPLDDFTSKVKVGQHLTAAVRGNMAVRLEGRGQADDWGALRLMERANGMAAEYPAMDGGLRWVDDPADVPLDALHQILSATYWAKDRPMAVVAENLRRSTLSLAALDGERLVAYARVVVAHPKVAWLFDVVVDEACRGRGLGQALVRRALAHRAVRGALRVFLDTRDAMSLYARFGFVELRRSTTRDSSLMVLERAAVDEVDGEELSEAPSCPAGFGRVEDLVVDDDALAQRQLSRA